MASIQDVADWFLSREAMCLKKVQIFCYYYEAWGLALCNQDFIDFQRVELVRKCEDAVKAQAKKRQLSRLVQNAVEAEVPVQENLPERWPEGKQSRVELGAMAGVSGKTYEHATKV